MSRGGLVLRCVDGRRLTAGESGREQERHSERLLPSRPLAGLSKTAKVCPRLAAGEAAEIT
jgi:hypothetical protein